MNKIVLEHKYFQKNSLVNNNHEEEVIKLAQSDSEEFLPKIPLSLNSRQSNNRNAITWQESEIETSQKPESNQVYSSEIENGVFDFNFNLGESFDNPLPFLNQPRYEYYSKSDAKFEDYLDWIVDNSSINPL